MALRPALTRGLAPAALVLAACGHGDPLRPVDHAPDEPFSLALPRRLTFNGGDDRAPAWLPAGPAFLYSGERLDRDDADRCLAELPGEGGSVRRSTCARSFGSDDSTDVFTAAAASAGGRLAFLAASSLLGHRTPDVVALRLATTADPGRSAVLLRLPYAAPSGTQHPWLSHLQWSGENTLLYLAGRFLYVAPNNAPDTIIQGLEVVRLSLGGGRPAVAVVPGTQSATSVAAGESEDVLYFTRLGEGRIYRHVISRGETTVVHDFGGRIARDVRRFGSRLLAVVGGKASVETDPALGAYQRDEGGELVIVDPATGTETAVASPGILVRLPAAAPAGARVLAEGYPFEVVVIRDQQGSVIAVDTAVARRADIWLYEGS